MLSTFFLYAFMFCGAILVICVIGLMWVGMTNRFEESSEIICWVGIIFGILGIIALCGQVLINVF